MKPSIQVLSVQEVIAIDKLTREMLNEIGVVCDDIEAMEIYKSGGALVDFSNNRVRFPSEVVDNALKYTSPMVKVHGRNGRAPLMIGGDNVYFGPTGFPTNLLDHETDTYRNSLYQDLVVSMQVSDTLTPPDYVVPNVGATDIDPKVIDLYEFKAALLNTNKPLMTQCQGRENLQKILKMAQVIAPEKGQLAHDPFFMLLVCLTSPLHLRKDSCELIIEGARAGVPLFVESGPIAGATSPATLYQTVAMANAEILANYVLAKMVNPDIPFIYASWSRIMDMKTGNVAIGGPEFALLRAATTQMAKFYCLPSGGGGAQADAKHLDPQFGAEITATTLLPVLAGINMIQGMALIANMNAVSLEALVIASESIEYVKHIAKGIGFPSSLSIDVEKEAGPKGNFITLRHTMDNFKKEMWFPTIFDRVPIKANSDQTHTGVRVRTKEKIKILLDKFKPPELPPEADTRLMEIING